MALLSAEVSPFAPASIQCPAASGHGALTNHAVDRAKEHRALSRGRGFAQVLHDQRAVAEDIDELAQVEEPHLLQVLPLLVSGSSTERQCEKSLSGVPVSLGSDALRKFWGA